MEDIEQLLLELREGRIDAQRFMECLLKLNATLQQKLLAAQQRIAELERQIATLPPPKIAEPFSLKAEEKRQEARGK
jgi:hypothetical protein